MTQEHLPWIIGALAVLAFLPIKGKPIWQIVRDKLYSSPTGEVVETEASTDAKKPGAIPSPAPLLLAAAAKLAEQGKFDAARATFALYIDSLTPDPPPAT